MSKRELWLYAAAVLAVTAWFAARWPAAWYGYPFEGFQDEVYLVDVAHAMVRDGTLNPRFFNYPSLTFDLLAAEYWVGDRLGALPLLAEEAGSGDGPGPDHYVWGRLLILAMATLAIPVTAELGRRLVGPLCGVAAACCLAVTPVFSGFSYLGTVNPPLALWSALAGLAAVGVLRRGARRDWVLAGVAAGLAVGTKYVAFPAALLAPLAWLLAPGPAGRGPRAWGPLVLFGAVAGATFLATSPFVLLDFETFSRDLARTGEVYNYEGNFHFHEGAGERSWVEIADRFVHRSFRLGPSLLAAVGLAWLAARRPRTAALLALVPVVAWLFLGSYKVFFPRNLMGAVPFVCVLAGGGVAAVASLGARLGPRGAGALGLACLAAALAQPFAVSRAEVQEDLAVDTRRAALEWLEEHAPPGACIVREERTPELETFSPSFEVRYIRSIAAAQRFDDLEGCDYVLLTVPFRRDVRTLDTYANERAAYADFMARHTLAAEFVGGDGRLAGRRIAIYALAD